MQTSLSLNMPLKGAWMYACVRASVRVHTHAQENEIPIIEQHTHALTEDQGHQNIPGLRLKKTNAPHLWAFRAQAATHTRTHIQTHSVFK